MTRKKQRRTESMVDIDGLIRLFGEMQKAGIENLRIAMDDKSGMKFCLVITPPAKSEENSGSS